MESCPAQIASGRWTAARALWVAICGDVQARLGVNIIARCSGSDTGAAVRTSSAWQEYDKTASVLRGRCRSVILEAEEDRDGDAASSVALRGCAFEMWV